MAFTATDYINRVREFVRDAATSKRVAPDDLSAQVGGGNKSFVAGNVNIVASPAPMAQIDGSGPYASSNVNLDDPANGLLSVPALITAPAVAFKAIYFYQFFADADITDLAIYGLSQVGVDATGFTPSSIPAGAANLANGLFMPACKYAASQGFENLAERFARLYDTSSEGETASKASITKNYLSLAQTMRKAADMDRLAYFGQAYDASTSPASVSQGTCFPGGDWTPRR